MGEIATIEIVTRSETEDIGLARQRGIEAETEIETDTPDQAVSAVDGAMSNEIEIGNLQEEGEEMMEEIETIGTPGAAGEGEEIGIEIEGIGNDLEKRTIIGGCQEDEVPHEM